MNITEILKAQKQEADKKMISIYLPAKEFSKLEALAQKHDVSRSKVIIALLNTIED